MKGYKIISLCFIILSFYSCSKDEISNPHLNSGALLKTKTVYNSLYQNTIPFICEYQYSNSDNLIKESNFEGQDKHLARYFTFEYNNINQLEKKYFFSENFENNDYEIIVKYEYEYTKGQLNSMTKYRKNAASENEFYVHEIHSYNYSEGDLMEEIINYEKTGSQTKFTFQFDENKNVIKKTESLFYSDDIFIYEWKYDNNKNKIEERRYRNEEETQKTIFEYSGMKLINAISYSGEDILRVINYEYDYSGNLIQEKKEIRNPLSNEMPELIIYEYY